MTLRDKWRTGASLIIYICLLFNIARLEPLFVRMFDKKQETVQKDPAWTQAAVLSTQRPCMRSQYQSSAASTAHWPVDRLTSPLTAALCEDNWRMMSPIEHQIGNRAGENIEAAAWTATHWFRTAWRQRRRLSSGQRPRGEKWEVLRSHIGNPYTFLITCGMWCCFNMGAVQDVVTLDWSDAWCCYHHDPFMNNTLPHLTLKHHFNSLCLCWFKAALVNILIIINNDCEKAPAHR